MSSLGLDFGTTHSAIAAVRDSHPTLATFSKGRLIQSLKAYLADRRFDGTAVFSKRYSLEDISRLSPAIPTPQCSRMAGNILGRMRREV